MKKPLFALSLALVFSSNLLAQQEIVYEYDDVIDPRPTRESYITNKWFDNIFLGAGVGLGTSFGKEIEKHYLFPTFNVSLLKWFSPTIGARIGYQHFITKEGLGGYAPYQMGSGHSALPYKLESTGKYSVNSDQPGTLNYGHAYVNFSILWNLTQFFGFYDPERFYNLSIYVDGGYSHLYDNKIKKGLGSPNYDREFSLGTGLYNTIRLNDRWNAFADLAFMGYSGDYRTDRGYVTFVPNLTMGVSYNIYKTKWNDKKKYVDRINDYQIENVEVKHENTVLEKTVESKVESINNLEGEVEELQRKLAKANAELDELRAKKYEYTVFFDLDNHKMSSAEKKRTKVYVGNALASNPNHVFYITGSADQGTGTPDHNVKLATRRADEVRNYLISLGVNEDKIVTREPLVTDSQMDASFDRRVFFEGK